MADVFNVKRGGYRAAKGESKSSQDKVLQRQELQALLDAPKDDRRRYGYDAYDLFAISGNFGLRCSEALDLEFADFTQLKSGYFRVSTLKRRKNLQDRVYTGDKGQVLLTDVLESRRRIAGKGGEKLFTFGSRTARYLWAFYCEKAGISPNVSFHALRHTAARMLLMSMRKTDLANEAMNIVTAFLRHKPSSTQIYTEPSAEDLIQAMNLKGIVR
jgi:integrase